MEQQEEEKGLENHIVKTNISSLWFILGDASLVGFGGLLYSVECAEIEELPTHHEPARVHVVMFIEGNTPGKGGFVPVVSAGGRVGDWDGYRFSGGLGRGDLAFGVGIRVIVLIGF